MHRRKIVDNIILVQEVVHSNKSNKDEGMMIKIDMANTFDRFHHSFLLEILFKFGFCPSSFDGYQHVSIILGSYL